MASGTISLGTNGYLEGRITWSSTSNGSSANSSEVKATIQAHRTNSYTTTGTWTGNLKIGGTNKTFSWYGSISSSWITLLSFTVTVAHNDNGKGTCLISGKITGPTGTSMEGTSVSGSATVTLDTIPRYPTAYQTLNSKTETTVKMNWSSDSTIDYLWYSTNNGSTWTGVNVADGKSGTYTISGLAANTTYQIKTRLRRKDSQLTKDSSALSVTTYNFPYATKMPSFTIGSELTITIYNPLGRNVTVNIIGDDGSNRGSNTTTGTTMGPYTNSGWVDYFYSTIPNKTSGTYKVKITYGSSEITKTGGTYTINTNACKPSISTLTYLDTNSTVTDITGNNQQIVQNQSIVQYNATGLTVKNSATIKSAILTVNGISYNLTVNGTTATGGNAKIDSASDVKAVLVLKDSRDLSAKKEINVTMLDWVLPSGIITLQRQNNYYSETSLNVDASYSSVGGKNTLTIQYRYKQITSSSYSSWVTLQDNVEITNTFDNNYEWNIQVRLTDKFGKTVYNLLLPRGIPIVFFDANKNSTGFNCFPSNEKSVEINGIDIYNYLFYSSGDNFKIVRASGGVNRLICVGNLTNGLTEVWFNITIPKSMRNVTPTISNLKCNIRKSEGGYLLSSGNVTEGYDVISDSSLTVYCAKSNDYTLTVEIQTSTAWTATNNTPVTVTIENLQIDFT